MPHAPHTAQAHSHVLLDQQLVPDLHYQAVKVLALKGQRQVGCGREPTKHISPKMLRSSALLLFYFKSMPPQRGPFECYHAAGEVPCSLTFALKTHIGSFYIY